MNNWIRFFSLKVFFFSTLNLPSYFSTEERVLFHRQAEYKYSYFLLEYRVRNYIYFDAFKYFVV